MLLPCATKLQKLNRFQNLFLLNFKFNFPDLIRHAIHIFIIPELLPHPHCLKAIFSRNFALFFNKLSLDSIQMIRFRAGKHEYVAFR